MKYLPKYYEWMENKRLPHGFGLCREFYNVKNGSSDSWLMKFKPLDYDDHDYCDDVNAYWGSEFNGPALGQFTPLRQTILLFLAAINKEL